MISDASVPGINFPVGTRWPVSYPVWNPGMAHDTRTRVQHKQQEQFNTEKLAISTSDSA